MTGLGRLNIFQKVLLVAMAMMAVAFSVAYAVTMARAGIMCDGSILVPTKEDGATVYRGEAKGKDVCFAVGPGKVVSCRLGDVEYGPYVVEDDPSAVPSSGPDVFPAEQPSMNLSGIEMSCGGQVVFRGAIDKSGPESLSIYDEGGKLEQSSLYNDGTLSSDAAPSVADVLRLIYAPVIRHKGSLEMLLLGWLVCAMGGVSILFADGLFRLSLLFRVRDVEGAEPTGLEIAGRYVLWVSLFVFALWVFVTGLLLS